MVMMEMKEKAEMRAISAPGNKKLPGKAGSFYYHSSNVFL